MIDLTKIILSIIGLVFTAVSTFLIPYLKQKLSAEKLSQLHMWAEVAVKAAEMLYEGAGRGEEKKTYVTEFLNNKGYNVDLDTIETLIESCVLDLKNTMAE